MLKYLLVLGSLMNTICTAQNSFIPFRYGDHWGYSYLDSLRIPCMYEDVSYSGDLQMRQDSLFVVKLNGKFGVINSTNETILPFQYDEVEVINKNLFVVQNGKNHGVIDQKLNTIIPFNYDEIYAKYEVLICKKEGKSCLFDFKGHPIIPCKRIRFEVRTCNYIIFYEYKKVLFSKKQKLFTGAMNHEGKIIIPKKYSFIGVFENGAYIETKKGAWLIDLKHKTNKISKRYDEIGEIRYKNDFTWVREGDIYGFINTSGAEIIPLKYEKAYTLDDDNGMFAKLNGKWGCINRNNTVIIDFKYDWLYRFENGFGFELGNKAGLLDSIGNLKIEIENNYDDLSWVNDSLLIVKENDLYGLYHTGKGWLLQPEYENLIRFKYTDKLEKIYFETEHNGFFGVVDMSGKVIIESKYKSMDTLSYPNMILVSYDSDFEDNFFIDIYGKEYRQ